MYYVCDVWPIKCVIHLLSMCPSWPGRRKCPCPSSVWPYPQKTSPQIPPSLAARNSARCPSHPRTETQNVAFSCLLPIFFWIFEIAKKKCLQMGCFMSLQRFLQMTESFLDEPMCSLRLAHPWGPSGPDWTKIGCERSLCQMTDITRAC